MDSIHVNQEVSFDATCSDSGKEFYWEFNTPSDTSTYIQKIVTRSFDSAGTVEIFLLVINGGKQASKKDYITILP
ncbi:MAG: hypothetical protein IPP77_05845 [Bacteroidetes bacterium]|nr:hypothetical protein [Bacteroidota bacterium]